MLSDEVKLGPVVGPMESDSPIPRPCSDTWPWAVGMLACIECRCAVNSLFAYRVLSIEPCADCARKRTAFNSTYSHREHPGLEPR